MLLERFREPIAKQSKHSTVCRRGNPIPVLLAGLAGLLFSAGHAAAQASPTWMGDLKPRIGHLQLNQLAIPGTHDTGTYSLDQNSILSDDFPLSSFQQEADTDLSYADPLGIFGLVSAFNSAFNGLLNPIIYNWAEAQDYCGSRKFKRRREEPVNRIGRFLKLPCFERELRAGEFTGFCQNAARRHWRARRSGQEEI